MALRSNDFGRATGLVSEAAALAVAAAFFFAFLGPACGKAKAVRSKTMNRDFLKDIVASEMGCEKKTEHSMPLFRRCKLRFEIFIRQYREGSTKVISSHYFLYCLSDGIATLLAQIHSIQRSRKPLRAHANSPRTKCNRHQPIRQWHGKPCGSQRIAQESDETGREGGATSGRRPDCGRDWDGQGDDCPPYPQLLIALTWTSD